MRHYFCQPRNRFRLPLTLWLLPMGRLPTSRGHLRCKLHINTLQTKVIMKKKQLVDVWCLKSRASLQSHQRQSFVCNIFTLSDLHTIFCSGLYFFGPKASISFESTKKLPADSRRNGNLTQNVNKPIKSWISGPRARKF